MNGLSGISPVPAAPGHEPPGRATAVEQKLRLLRERHAPAPENAGTGEPPRERRGDGASQRRPDGQAPCEVALAGTGEGTAPGRIIDIYV